jgi:hypothetical protein
LQRSALSAAKAILNDECFKKHVSGQKENRPAGDRAETLFNLESLTTDD